MFSKALAWVILMTNNIYHFLEKHAPLRFSKTIQPPVMAHLPSLIIRDEHGRRYGASVAAAASSSAMFDSAIKAPPAVEPIRPLFDSANAQYEADSPYLAVHLFWPSVIIALLLSLLWVLRNRRRCLSTLRDFFKPIDPKRYLWFLSLDDVYKVLPARVNSPTLPQNLPHLLMDDVCIVPRANADSPSTWVPPQMPDFLWDLIIGHVCPSKPPTMVDSGTSTVNFSRDESAQTNESFLRNDTAERVELEQKLRYACANIRFVQFDLEEQQKHHAAKTAEAVNDAVEKARKDVEKEYDPKISNLQKQLAEHVNTISALKAQSEKKASAWKSAEEKHDKKEKHIRKNCEERVLQARIAGRNEGLNSAKKQHIEEMIQADAARKKLDEQITQLKQLIQDRNRTIAGWEKQQAADKKKKEKVQQKHSTEISDLKSQLELKDEELAVEKKKEEERQQQSTQISNLESKLKLKDEELAAEKKKEKELQQQSTQISNLKSQLAVKNKKLAAERKKGEQKVTKIHKKHANQVIKMQKKHKGQVAALEAKLKQGNDAFVAKMKQADAMLANTGKELTSIRADLESELAKLDDGLHTSKTDSKDDKPTVENKGAMENKSDIPEQPTNAEPIPQPNSKDNTPTVENNGAEKNVTDLPEQPTNAEPIPQPDCKDDTPTVENKGAKENVNGIPQPPTNAEEKATNLPTDLPAQSTNAENNPQPDAGIDHDLFDKFIEMGDTEDANKKNVTNLPEQPTNADTITQPKTLFTPVDNPDVFPQYFPKDANDVILDLDFIEGINGTTGAEDTNKQNVTNLPEQPTNADTITQPKTPLTVADVTDMFRKNFPQEKDLVNDEDDGEIDTGGIEGDMDWVNRFLGTTGAEDTNKQNVTNLPEQSTSGAGTDIFDLANPDFIDDYFNWNDVDAANKRAEEAEQRAQKAQQKLKEVKGRIEQLEEANKQIRKLVEELKAKASGSGGEAEGDKRAG